MKKIGFLSFGHWAPSPQSQTRSAADALLQSIDLAVEAERLGMDGAYLRVHHFARHMSYPVPTLSAGALLELGISRGSHEQVIEGWRYFGLLPAEGENDEDMGRRHGQEFLNL